MKNKTGKIGNNVGFTTTSGTIRQLTKAELKQQEANIKAMQKQGGRF